MFRGDGLEIEGRDPVDHAAREVVRALIGTRWSLEAAVVVVALRRLCEAVAARECLTRAGRPDVMLGSWAGSWGWGIESGCASLPKARSVLTEMTIGGQLDESV